MSDVRAPTPVEQANAAAIEERLEECWGKAHEYMRVRAYQAAGKMISDLLWLCRFYQRRIEHLTKVNKEWEALADRWTETLNKPKMKKRKET